MVQFSYVVLILSPSPQQTAIVFTVPSISDHMMVHSIVHAAPLYLIAR